MTVSEIRRHPDYANASCPRGLLCDYSNVAAYSDSIVDVCVQCGRKLVYRIVDGRIDNAKYGRDHIRDILQSGSVAFEEIYGRRDPRDPPKEKRKIEDILDEVKDEIRTEKRKSFS